MPYDPNAKLAPGLLPTVEWQEIEDLIQDYTRLKHCFYVFTSASAPMQILFNDVLRKITDRTQPLSPELLAALLRAMLAINPKKDKKTFQAFADLRKKFETIWSQVSYYSRGSEYLTQHDLIIFYQNPQSLQQLVTAMNWLNHTYEKHIALTGKSDGKGAPYALRKLIYDNPMRAPTIASVFAELVLDPHDKVEQIIDKILHHLPKPKSAATTSMFTVKPILPAAGIQPEQGSIYDLKHAP